MFDYNVKKNYYLLIIQTFICCALLKKLYLFNPVWFLFQSLFSKCKTKYIFGRESFTVVYISFILSEYSDEHILSPIIGWQTKYKKISLSCFHWSRDLTYFESPNFPNFAMYYILPHVSILLSDININTPCFFKSLTSGVSLSEPSKKETLFNNIIMFTCKTNKLQSLKCISLPHAHWTYATGSLNGSQETLYGLQKSFSHETMCTLFTRHVLDTPLSRSIFFSNKSSQIFSLIQ